jgi:hypothetical protein
MPSARFDAPPIEGLAVLTLPILGAEDFTEPPFLNGESTFLQISVPEPFLVTAMQLALECRARFKTLKVHERQRSSGFP